VRFTLLQKTRQFFLPGSDLPTEIISLTAYLMTSSDENYGNQGKIWLLACLLGSYAFKVTGPSVVGKCYKNHTKMRENPHIAAM